MGQSIQEWTKYKLKTAFKNINLVHSWIPWPIGTYMYVFFSKQASFGQQLLVSVILIIFNFLMTAGNKTSYILKGYVRYIFACLFFKSKGEHLENKEKCFLFHFKISFRSREN